MALNTELNIADPDAFYESLIETHADLDDAQSHALNACLARLLSACIGDAGVVQEAVRIAGADDVPAGSPEHDARLILLLANHIGDAATLAATLRQARLAAGDPHCKRL